MNQEIFKSDRYFIVYDYQVSHGQLLIRSDKRKGGNVNIDVIFFDISFLQLFTMLYGITIRLVNANTVVDYNSVNKYLNNANNNLFEIESGSEKYYITAAFVKIFENDLAFNETSLGYNETVRGKEVAASR